MLNYPVIPVAGPGLGVTYSSRNQVKESLPLTGLGQAKIPFYANMTSGNLMVEDPPVTLMEPNGPLSFSYFYNSQASSLATAWRLTTVKRFLSLPSTKPPYGTSAILEETDGHHTTYTRGAETLLFEAPGFGDGTPELKFDEANKRWCWHHPGTGIIEYYDTEGYQTQRMDAEGRITRYAYDDAEPRRLVSIRGASGALYEIRYEDKDVGVFVIQGDEAVPLHTYHFDTDHRLIRSVNRDNYTINYEYYPASTRLAVVSQSDGTSANFIYEPSPQQHRVKRMRTGGLQSPSLTFEKENLRWRWHHPASGITAYYNPQGELLEQVDKEGKSLPIPENAPRLEGYHITEAGKHQVTWSNAAGEKQTVELDDPIFYDMYYTNDQNSRAEFQTGMGSVYLELDSQGRLAAWVEQRGYNNPIPGQDTTRYTYAPEGQVAKVTYPDLSEEQTSYDPVYGVITQQIKPGNQTTQTIYQPDYLKARPVCVIQDTEDKKKPVVTRYVYDWFYGLLLAPPDTEITEKTIPARGIVLQKAGDVLHAYFRNASLEIEHRIFNVTEEEKALLEFPGAGKLVEFPRLKKHITLMEKVVAFCGLTEDYNTFLRFSLSPEGVVTEYRPDNRGNVGSARTYLEKRFDLSEFKPDESIGLETMTDWVKTQNPQAISLQEYEYDPYGQLGKTSTYTEIKPDGTGKLTQDTGVNETFWDPTGEWFLKRDRHSDTATAQRHQKHDDLRRLTEASVEVTDKVKAITTIDYLDAKSQVQITQPNGRVELTTQDNSGLTAEREASVTVDGQLETRTTYSERDPAGRPVITHHPDGRLTYTFYDRQQRLGFAVSHTGIVTAHEYNREHRYQATTTYAKAIAIKDMYLIYPPPPGFLPQGSQVIKAVKKIANAAEDRTSYTFFDTANRPWFEVDAKGYVTETRYDLLGRPIATIAYHDQISAEELTQLKAGNGITRTPDVTKDRCHRTFYDNDNHIIGTQDPGGYVVQDKRDVPGRISEIIRYATKMPIDFSVTNFSDICPKPSPEDAHTWYFYNARNQKTKKVNAKGYITTYSYLACGLLKEAITYATPATEWLKNPVGEPMPELSDTFQRTAYDYDLVGRLIEQDDPLALAHLTSYDIMGNINSKIEQDLFEPLKIDPDHQRHTENQRDGWEQIRAKANSFVAQELDAIDADPSLTPEEKAVAKKAIWENGSTRYTLDPTGLLLKTTNALNHSTIIYYDLERRPIVSISPRGAIIEKTLNNFGEATSTRRYKKRIPAEALSKLTGGFITPEVQNLLDGLKDPANDRITQTTPDQRGQPIETIDPEGNKTQADYNAFKECEKQELPVDEKEPTKTITHQFNTRGLEEKTTQAAGSLKITQTREYDNLYGKETKRSEPVYGDTPTAFTTTDYDTLGQTHTVTNPLLEATTFDQDAYGRVTQETNALQESTTTTYDDATRTKTQHFPATPQFPNGTQTSVQSNAFKETIALSTPITDTRTATETFTHAPDGQVAVHTDALSNKTIDDYNTLGKKTEHTDAASVKTVYTYNADEQLETTVEDTQGKKRTTTVDRNSFGEPEQVTDPRQIVTTNTFSPNGHCVKSVLDPNHDGYTGLNITTQTTFNAQGSKTSLMQGDATTPNQALTTFQHDPLGRNTGETKDPITPENPSGLNIQTGELLNAKGKTIAKIDPLGNTTWFFYDEVNRLRLRVDPLGGIREWEYDKAGKITLRRDYDIAYPTPNSITANTTLAEALTQCHVSTQDSLRIYFYEENGQERFRVTGMGKIIEKGYNQASWQDLTIRYSITLDPAVIPTLTTAKIVEFLAQHPDPQARVTFDILDDEGQIRFIIEANRLTEQRFDEKGRVIAHIVYANAVTDPVKLATLPPDQVLTSGLVQVDPSRDAATWTVYTVFDKPWFTVDPEGAVIRFDHDNNNNLVGTVAFATAIMIPTTYAQLVTALTALVPDPTKDRITGARFDNQNRRICKIDALLYEDIIVRNALGKKTQRTDRENNVWRFDRDPVQRRIRKIAPVVGVTRVVPDPDHPGFLTTKYDNIAVAKRTAYYATGAVQAVIQGDGLPEARWLNFSYNQRKQLEHTLQLAAIDNAEAPTGQPILVNLQSTVRYNPKGKKVAEQRSMPIAALDAKEKDSATPTTNMDLTTAPGWIFYVLDADGDLRYTVTGEGGVVETEPNAFSETANKTLFITKVVLPLSQYTATGIIPLTVLEAAITKQGLRNNPDNRETHYELDGIGRITHVRKKALPYYEPLATPNLGTAEPTTERFYNAQNKWIIKTELRGPGLKKARRRWHDRCGRIVAEAVDLSWANPVSPETAFKVTRITYTVFGQEQARHEYDTFLPQNPFAWTLAQLDKALALIVTLDDHLRVKIYDVRGLCVKDTRAAVVLQTTKDKNIVDLPPVNIGTWHQYNKTELRVATTGPDGVSTEYWYFNAAGGLIGKADVPRLNQWGDKAVTFIPLTYLFPDAFEVSVATIRFALGTLKADRDSLPIPVAPTDPNNQTDMTMMDNRGLPVAVENALGNILFRGFTAMRKLASTKQVVTTFTVKPPYTPIQNWDEKQLTYDIMDRPVLLNVLRNDAVVQSTRTDYNVFDQVIAVADGSQSPVNFEDTSDEKEKEKEPDTHERNTNGSIREKGKEKINDAAMRDAGVGNSGNAMFNRYNTAGAEVMSNAGSGVTTLRLQNLAGDLTLTAVATQTDMSSMPLNQAGIQTLFGLPLSDLERTINLLDNDGQTRLQYLPAYTEIVPGLKTLPLNVSVQQDPAEDDLRVSWHRPAEWMFNARFFIALYPGADWKELSVVSAANEDRVNVSSLPTGRYRYRMDHYLSSEVKGTPQEAYYQTTGDIQWVNHQCEESLALIGDVVDGSTLRLRGKTSGLTAITLWQDNHYIGTFANLRWDLEEKSALIDLPDLTSGIYTFKPVGGDETTVMSLPFTLVTDHVGFTPVSWEIQSQVSLLVTGDCGVLHCGLSADVNAETLKLVCNYESEEGETYCQETVVRPRKDLLDVNSLSVDLHFEHPVTAITSLTLSVLLAKANPSAEDEWLMLYQDAAPLAADDPGLLPASFLQPSWTTRRGGSIEDWIRITETGKYIVESQPKSRDVTLDGCKEKGKEKAETALPQVIAHFGSRLLLYVRLPINVTDTPQLRFFDTSKSLQGHWQTLTIKCVTPLGVVVDVTGLPRGLYTYMLNGEQMGTPLCIAGGSAVFSSNTETLEAPTEEVLPIRQFRYNAWRRQIQKIDSLNHTTTLAYTQAMQVRKETLPLITILDSNDKEIDVTPTTEYAWNEWGDQFASKDPNNNLSFSFFNKAKQLLIHILGDGTVAFRQSWDPLGRIPFRWDSRFQLTIQLFDRLNQLVQVKVPDNNNINLLYQYYYNQVKQLISVIDPANQVTFYNYSALGDITDRVEPMGQVTSYVSDRNHRWVQVVHGDGGISLYTRNFFGLLLEMIDRGGRHTEYSYDQKLQLIHQFGLLSQLYPAVRLKEIWQASGTIYYQEIYLAHQDLAYTYQVGRVIQVDDKSDPLVLQQSFFRYDREGRRLRAKAQTVEFGQATLIQDVTTQKNALGWSTYTVDGFGAILEEMYDAVGNRRALILAALALTTARTWTFDAAKRVLTDTMLMNGVLYIAWAYDYAYGFRVSQTATTLMNGTIKEELNFYNDGSLGQITIPQEGVVMGQTYSRAGWRNLYISNWYDSTEVTTCNANGELTEDVMVQASLTGGWQETKTDYAMSATGLPTQQVTGYIDTSPGKEVSCLDTVNFGYTCVNDEWRQISAGGSRVNNLTHQISPYAYAAMVYDVNGLPNAKYGAETQKFSYTPDQSITAVFFAGTFEQILTKTVLMTTINPVDEFKGNMSTTQVVQSRFITTVDGRPIAEYAFAPNGQFPATVNGGYTGHGFGAMGGYELGWSPSGINLIDAVQPVGFMPVQTQISQPNAALNRPIPRLQASSPQTLYPSPTLEKVVAGLDDSYDTIATRLGDSHLAEQIAAYNHLPNVSPGMEVAIPNVIPMYNDVNVAPNYAIFMNTMIGALNPHFVSPQAPYQPPHHHKSFWKEVAVGVVGVAASMLAGPLGAYLAAQLSIVALGGIAALTMAAGAVLDLAGQGILLGMKAESHLNWSEVFATGMSAGSLKMFGVNDAWSFGNALHAAEAAGTASVMEQLERLSTGEQKEFNIAWVAEAMASAVEALGLDNGMSAKLGAGFSTELSEGVVNAGVDILTSGIIEGRLPDLESIEANAFGTVIGIAALGPVAQELENATPTSPATHYQRAKANVPKHQADSTNAAEFANAASHAGSAVGRFAALPPDIRITDADHTLNRTGVATGRHAATSDATRELLTQNTNLTRQKGYLNQATKQNPWQTGQRGAPSTHHPEHSPAKIPQPRLKQQAQGTAGKAQGQNRARAKMGMPGEFVSAGRNGLEMLGTAGLNDVEDFYHLGAGIGEGIIDMGKGIYEAFSDPMGTAKGLGNAISHSGKVVDAVENNVHDILTHPGAERWHLIGSDLTFFGGGVVLKGMSEVSELGRLGRVAKGVGEGVGLTTRLNRAQIRNYLSNVHTIPREQLIQDLESVGLKFKGSAEDGKFMSFVDKQANIRVKIHPSDRVTQYDHTHIYNKQGQDLSAELSIVNYRSPEAHIEIAPDDFDYSQEYYKRMINGR